MPYYCFQCLNQYFHFLHLSHCCWAISLVNLPHQPRIWHTSFSAWNKGVCGYWWWCDIFYKAHYPYYYTVMCYLALCMDIKFSTLIEICRCPQCWKFWKQGQTTKVGTTFHTLYKMCMGSWTFPAYQYRDNVWYRV